MWKTVKYVGEISVYCVFISAALWMYIQKANGNPFGMPAVLDTKSMEPVFNYGDLLFSHYRVSDLKIGDIIAFQLSNFNYSIIHRIIEIQDNGRNEPCYITKGDNSRLDDRFLYPIGKRCVLKEDIHGKVFEHFKIPYLGHIYLFFDNFPYFKMFIQILVVLVFSLKALQRYVRLPRLLRIFVNFF